MKRVLNVVLIALTIWIAAWFLFGVFDKHLTANILTSWLTIQGSITEFNTIFSSGKFITLGSLILFLGYTVFFVFTFINCILKRNFKYIPGVVIGYCGSIIVAFTGFVFVTEFGDVNSFVFDKVFIESLVKRTMFLIGAVNVVLSGIALIPVQLLMMLATLKRH